jgi:hypothetical protein
MIAASTLVCADCGEETTMALSHATGGRNPLKRKCVECGATTKGMYPDKRARKTNALPSADQKEKERELDALRMKVKGMTTEQRQQFFKDQKDRRKLEGKSVPRTFAEPKAFVQQEKVVHKDNDEVDTYETFEDWAPRQLTMGLCKNLHDAEEAWKRALKKPGAQVITRRGTFLLGRFAGVRIATGTQDKLSAAIKQSREIESAADLADFEETAESNIERFNRTQNNATRCAADKGPSIGASDVDMLITAEDERSPDMVLKRSIYASLEKRDEAQRLFDEALMAEATIAAEELATKKKSERDAAKAEGDSVAPTYIAAIEVVNARAAVDKAQSSMSAIVWKHSQAVALLKVEVDNLRADAGGDIEKNFKADSEEKSKQVGWAWFRRGLTWGPVP